MAKAARFFGLSCIFLAPLAMLLVVYEAANPFIDGKTIAFRLLAIGAFAAALLTESTFRKISAPLAFYGLFAMVMLLADLGGTHPHAAIFGTAETREGFVAVMSYGLYFWAVTALVDDDRLWGWFISAWAMSGALAALSGVYQAAFMMAHLMPLKEISGVIGGRNFMASYLLFGAVFALLAAVRANKWYARDLWTLAVGLDVSVAIFTGSRGGLVGFAVFGVAVLLLMPREALRPKALMLSIFMAGIVAILGLNDALSADSMIGRLSGFFDSANRVGIWSGTWPLVLRHPFLGWGHDGVALLYNSALFTRFYNLGFDLMAAGGVLGLLTFVGALVSAGVVAYRSLSPMERAVTLAGLVGYVAVDMFIFDTITASVALVALLAYAGRRSNLLAFRRAPVVSVVA